MGETHGYTCQSSGVKACSGVNLKQGMTGNEQDRSGAGHVELMKVCKVKVGKIVSVCPNFNASVLEGNIFRKRSIHNAYSTFIKGAWCKMLK